MNSIASEELQFKPEIKTAIIYSVVETNSFIVEIHYQSKSYYISTNDDPIQFNNLSLAKQSAMKEGALQGYQALENLYQEIGASTKGSIKNTQRYEYIFFNLD